MSIPPIPQERHFNVLNFFDGPHIVPPVPNENIIGRLRFETRKIFEKSPDAAAMPIKLPNNAVLTLVWKRVKAKAGYIVWLDSNRLIGATLYLSGMDNDADKEALNQVRQLPVIDQKPQRDWDFVTTSERPVVANFILGTETAAQFPIFEGSVALADSFFRSLNAISTKALETRTPQHLN